MVTIMDGTVKWRVEDVRTWGLTQRVQALEDKIVHLTQAEYNALPDTKLTDGKLYFIDDVD